MIIIPLRKDRFRLSCPCVWTMRVVPDLIVLFFSIYIVPPPWYLPRQKVDLFYYNFTNFFLFIHFHRSF